MRFLYIFFLLFFSFKARIVLAVLRYKEGREKKSWKRPRVIFFYKLRLLWVSFSCLLFFSCRWRKEIDFRCWTACLPNTFLLSLVKFDSKSTPYIMTSRETFCVPFAINNVVMLLKPIISLYENLFKP